MSPKEFPFPKIAREDASTNSSSPPETYYRQPVQPVPLITHIPDPPQQTVPVVQGPEPQSQPQQTVPAYRPESRQQLRTQPNVNIPAIRSEARQQPRGARQPSFATAYSPASRQQQYLPDPPQTTRTPSPVRPQQYRHEPQPTVRPINPEPQPTVRPISPEPQRQSIPTYRPQSRLEHRRPDPRQSVRARSPDPPPVSDLGYLPAGRPAGQPSMRVPSKAQSSTLSAQTVPSNITSRPIETGRRTVESERRTVGSERRTLEPERRTVGSERRTTATERRPSAVRPRSDSVHTAPTQIVGQKRSSSRQGSAREAHRAMSSGTESEDQHNRLPRSRKPSSNTPRTQPYVEDDDDDDHSNSQPSTSRPFPRRVSSGSEGEPEVRPARNKPRGLNFHDAKTYMSSGRPVRAGDWDAGQPHQAPPPSPYSSSSTTTHPSTPTRLIVSPHRSGGYPPPTPPLPSDPSDTGKMNNRIGWALFLNSGIKNHLVATLGELIGTTMFLFFAFAGTVVANINSPSSTGLSTTGLTTGWNVTKLLYVSFSFGFSLMVNVWIFFRISGGLFNPAVTLALLLTGAIGFVRALFLFFAQIAGSIAASALLIGLFPAPANVRTTLSSGLSIPKGLFIEVFLTAELVFTILMLAKEKHRATFIAPVGIGLALFIAELVGVYWTGGSLNPARSIGPSIVTWTWDHEHWIYWVGPLTGSLVAVGFYALIKALEYELANPGQDADSAGQPSPERTMMTRQENVRRRLMDAMGYDYDVVGQRGSAEYDNLGKGEMGLMKPGVVYASRGGSRPVSGAYPAGPPPQFGNLGSPVRNSGENHREEGLSVRDMEYEGGAGGAGGRRQQGRRERGER
ncbi:hypothetical protein FKW77_001149 [Venturia effusa]|uniref:Aquaporin n=1 Tax=Venturia effusa TaxID=50376 RepID=A0A517KVS7_9PEZI|nr:hypothetical protein FKW77_001149 [Venturia effusa]